MDTNRLPVGSKLALGAVAALAILGVVFVTWFFYVVYVTDPREYVRNDANYFWSGARYGSVVVVLAVATIVLTRLIWRSIAGGVTASKTIYGLTALVGVLWLPLALISPSMIIFPIIAMLLLTLHSLLGRRATRISSQRNGQQT